jgi:hypothetical protein
MEPYLEHDFAISDITVIELLGIKNIDDLTLKNKKKIIDALYVYPLTDVIKKGTIS